MKHSFFKLPETGDELLDFRLALRLLMRQAFGPVLGQTGHVAPRHAVAPASKPSLIPALRLVLRNNLRYVSENAYRLQRLFPVMSELSASAKVTNTKMITPAEKLRDGMWVEYNKHAVVIARGTYTKNMKNGLWREYYDTGELMIEENYLLGALHGRFATFHPNGQCCSDGHYDHGRREGRFFMYDETGQHVRTLTFKRDQLVDDLIVEHQLALA